jgi:hypothetical protein
VFSLQFDIVSIPDWAAQYAYPKSETEIETIIAPHTKAAGYYERSHFLTLCKWKSARPTKQYEKNTADFIRDVTQASLSTTNEQLRIEILTLLRGVKLPTASVLLHFGATDPYPILDFRALWSLGVEIAPSRYDFDLWWQYTLFCRQLAEKAGVSMRTLDKALWQYSKANQPSSP